MTTSANAVAVELRGLRRTFGKVTALDNFDLDIAPGELIALLGPSGCGKTTALRILSGLEEPDSGTVSVGGRDITHTAPNKRNMAMMFQSYSLFPHLTVAGNIDFALSMRKVARGARKEIIDYYLELVGLASHQDRLPSELSGGQQQRVALARALASKPDVLLLDEPLSALDAKVRVQLRDEIRRIQLELGTTTLFVTHDQGEALAMADRVGVMQSGKLEQLSSPRDLYDRPATEFVARFIGNTNRVPASVRDGHVDIFGRRVPVLPGSVAGDGVALVRPERVLVTAEGAAIAEGVAGQQAHITLLAFLGDHAKVYLTTPENRQLSAYVHARDAEHLTQGESVVLTVDPAPVLVSASESSELG